MNTEPTTAQEVETMAADALTSELRTTDATPIEPHAQRTARGGAPRGNRNNMRHGLRSSRLPKDSRFIENSVDAIRRNVEDALMAARGSVSLTDAFMVNSIVRHEVRAQKVAHYLRTAKPGDLTIPERCQLLAQISDATDKRDRAMRALSLDASQANVIDDYYRRPLPAEGQSAGPANRDAADVHQGAETP